MAFISQPPRQMSHQETRRQWITNIALVLASLVVAALMLELGSWLWIKYFRENHLARWEFYATRPPPYRDADYFGPEFLAEAQASVAGRLTDVAELADFRGRFFNVKGGFRVTTDLPAHATRRVLIFGGSTLFGQEVPDSHTIPSHLQRLLNGRGLAWEVRNFGIPGMNAAQQTRIVAQVEIRKGDLVLYYHGVNDIFYLVFGGYREGWVHGVPAFRPVQKLGALHKTLHAWHERFKDYSFTAQLALDVYQRGKPLTVTDEHELTRNLELAATRFRSALEGAARIAGNAGARFVHFLQPQVFAGTHMSGYEKALVSNPLLTPPGVDAAFRRGYPVLRKVAEDLQHVPYADISNALEGRSAGNEVYLDFCHLAHEGNEMVARHILDVIVRGQTARQVN